MSLSSPRLGFLCLAVACLAAPVGAGAADLQPVGSLLGLPPHQVAVQGAYAYCAADTLVQYDNSAHQATRAALQVYDVADPTCPRVVGVVLLDGLVRDLAAAGPYVYAVGDQLEVIDVSDPTVPARVAALPCGALGVSLAGSHLYAASPDTGVYVFDISTPAAPVGIGLLPTAAYHVTVAGELAYVAGGDKLLVLDVSSPAAPVEIGRMDRDLHGDPISYVTSRIALSGDRAIYGVPGGCVVVDVSDPRAPVHLATYQSLSVGFWLDYPVEVCARGDYAYLAARSAGVEVVDVSVPTQPTAVGLHDTPGHARRMVISEGCAYVADYEGGLRVFDLPDAAHLEELGAAGAPAFAHRLAAAGDYLYGAAWSGHQLLAMHIGERASPRLVGGAYDSQSCFGNALAIAGGHAYLGTVGECSGLVVHDLSSPEAPRYIGTLDEPAAVYAIAPAGRYVYVSSHGDLKVLDAADPAAPEVVGTLAGPGPGAPGLAADGARQLAVIAHSIYGFGVVDVSDPQRPTALALHDTPGTATAVALSGPYLFVGDGDVLRVFDLRVPSQPLEIASWTCDGLHTADLHILGSYLYLTDWSYGLRVLGVSDPLNPAQVGSCALPVGPEVYALEGLLGASGLAVSGEHVYVADYGWGIHVFELTTAFADVPADHWAADAVQRCASRGVVAGYPDGRYHPEYPCTRDQMAVYLSRALAGGDEHVPDPSGEPAFPDVTPDHWAYKYVECIRQRGIAAGYQDGLYHPEYEVDRGQMAVFLARAIAGDDDSVPEGPPTPTFPDVTREHWAYRHVECIAGRRIAHGYPDELYHPELICTRDQMAVYVTRAFGLLP